MSAFAHLCLNCFTREVAGAFADDNGEGFCSGDCQEIAHTEAAEHFAAEVLPKCAECGDYADTCHPNGDSMCRVCWTYEDDDHYWEQRELRSA